MKGKRTFVTMLILGLTLILMTGLGLAQGPAPQSIAAPQEVVGTAFTYQGRLQNASGQVNGTCDFEFGLWDAAGSGSPPSGGSQIGTQTKTNVTVNDGLFTVELDYGTGFSVFSGSARWLQIAVRCPAGSGTYATLSPRQPLTPAPYALSLRPGASIHNTATGLTNHGLALYSNDGIGLYVGSAGSDGVHVASTHDDGVHVNSADGSGVEIGYADHDGVFVNQVGSSTTTNTSTFKNGFEVAGAQGYGLYVGWADLEGVHVQDAGGDGVHVQDAGGNGVWAYTSGAGSGVLGKSLTGYGVRGETSAPGRSGVYGWHGGNGEGVTGFSSSGVALAAVGTGVIRSTADTVLYLSPHDMVVRQENPGLVSLTPLGGGGVRVRNEVGNTVTRYLSIPVSTFGQLFGAQLYVKSLEVCYKATTGLSTSYIEATTVSKNTGSDSGEVYYIYDLTQRDSTTYECYPLTATTPRVPINNSTWVQFNMYFAGIDSDIYIYTVKLTLTEDQN